MGIGHRTGDVLERARATGRTPLDIAEELADERLRAPGLRTDLNRRTCPPSRSDPRDNQEGDGNQPRGKPGGMSLGVADRGSEWTTWSIW